MTTTPLERQRTFPFEGMLPLADSGYNAAIMQVPMPPRIRSLKVSPKGFPTPWFVATIDGEADFRVIRPGAIKQAYEKRKCWVCGGDLGRYYALVLGPMCVVNRTISEPASHRHCALYSAVACPFLSNPRMRRHEAGMPENRISAPGHALERNPGVAAVWITRSYRPFALPKAQGGGTLFTFDDPDEVLWFCEGQPATFDQVKAALDSGLPTLHEMAVAEGDDAVRALDRQMAEALAFLPHPRSGVSFHHQRKRSA
jgi:hypothetical protein